MAKVAINLNEKIPSDEDEVCNPTHNATIGSSDPSPATGAVTDHAVDASVEPSAAPSDGISGKALKETGEPKSVMAFIGSQAGNGSSTAPVDEVQRKIRRAERFGVPVQLSEAEKRNSRAERFGTKKPEGLYKSEELKRKARAERFGILASEAVNEEAKKRARLARFASNAVTVSSEEERRKARAIRLSNIPTSISQVNSKAAVAGGASGGA